MNKINRKIALILAFLMIFTSVFTFTVSAAYKNGDKLGDVLNSDIKTYINGERIPCYNIKNKAVVLVADLRNYGFDVNYSSSTRTSAITRNYGKKFTPIQDIENTTSGKIGSVAFSYLFSDIVATLNGKQIESFNVQGNLAIFFDSLGDYGSFTWDSATKSSKLTLYGSDKESQTLPKTIKINGKEYSTGLTELILENEELTNSDIELIKYMVNLTQLNLGFTKINDITELKGLTNLTRLELYGNQIKNINALENLTNLTYLCLQINQISDISALKSLNNLEMLEVWDNQISDIRALKPLTNLIWLNLSNNQISDINVLKSLTNLTHLWLTNNPLNVAQIVELQAALPNCEIYF